MQRFLTIITLAAVTVTPVRADPVTAGAILAATAALANPVSGLPHCVPTAASAPNGQSVVAWVDEVNGVRALRVQFMDATGAVVSGPSALSLGSLNPVNTACAATPNGFMVAFDADTATTVGLRDIHYRTFDLAGNQTGSGQANLLTSLDEGRVKVAGNYPGNYAVVWVRRQSFGSTPSAGVYLRRFDSQGTPLDAGEIRVDDPTTLSFNGQDGPSVGLWNNGRAIVAWHDGVFNAGVSVPSPDGHGMGIVYRILDSTMAPATAPMVANANTANDQFDPLIATDYRGRATIAWCGDIQPVTVDAWCRRFDTQGASLDTTDLNLTPGNLASSQFAMDVEMTSNGEIVASWQDGTSTTGQPAPRCGWARLDQNRVVFDSGVTESGGSSADIHGFPRLGCDQYGNFIAAWQVITTANNSAAVRVRRYQRNMISVTSLTPAIGGFLTVSLDSPSDANNPYLLGASGGPGPFTVDTRTVGLSMDPLLDYVVNQGGGIAGPIFYNFTGVLDGNGQSNFPGIIIPNLPALSGASVWFTFATGGGSGVPSGVNTVSHSLSVTIQ